MLWEILFSAPALDSVFVCSVPCTTEQMQICFVQCPLVPDCPQTLFSKSFPLYQGCQQEFILTTPQTDHVSILAAGRNSRVCVRFDASACDAAATGAVLRRRRSCGHAHAHARDSEQDQSSRWEHSPQIHPQLLQTPLQHSQYISEAL